MRLVRYALAAMVMTLSVGTAQAGELAGPTIQVAVPGFGVDAVDDAELSGITGMGPLNVGLARGLIQDDWQGNARQTAGILPVTFENWFNDIGNTLVAENVRATLP